MFASCVLRTSVSWVSTTTVAYHVIQVGRASATTVNQYLVSLLANTQLSPRLLHHNERPLKWQQCWPSVSKVSAACGSCMLVKRQMLFVDNVSQWLVDMLLEYQLICRQTLGCYAVILYLLLCCTQLFHTQVWISLYLNGWSICIQFTDRFLLKYTLI